MALQSTDDMKKTPLMAKEPNDAENPPLVDSAAAKATVDDQAQSSSDAGSTKDVELGDPSRTATGTEKRGDPQSSVKEEKETRDARDPPSSPKERSKGPTIDGMILPQGDPEEKSFFSRFFGLDLPAWVYGALLFVISLVAYGVVKLLLSSGASSTAVTDTVEVEHNPAQGDIQAAAVETENVVELDEGEDDASAAKIETYTDEGGTSTDTNEGEHDASAAKIEEDVHPSLSKVNEAIALVKDRPDLLVSVKAAQREMVSVLQKPEGVLSMDFAKASVALSDALTAVQEHATTNDYWKCDMIDGAKSRHKGAGCKCQLGHYLQPKQEWFGAVRCTATGHRWWSKDMIGGLYGLCECAKEIKRTDCERFAPGSKAYDSEYDKLKPVSKNNTDQKQMMDAANAFSTQVGRQCLCRTFVAGKGGLKNGKTLLSGETHKRKMQGSKPGVLGGEECSQRGQVFFNIRKSAGTCECVPAEDTESKALQDVAETVAQYHIFHFMVSVKESKATTDKVRKYLDKNKGELVAGGGVTLFVGGSIACAVFVPGCLPVIAFLASLSPR